MQAWDDKSVEAAIRKLDAMRKACHTVPTTPQGREEATNAT